MQGHSEQLDTKKVRRYLIFLIIVLMVVTTTIIFYKLKTEQDLDKIAKINTLKTQDAPTTRLLLLNFEVNQDQSDKPFKLTSVNSYNSHLGTISSLQKAGYRLNLIRDGKSLYEYYFAVPQTRSEYVEPQTGDYISLGVIKAKVISIQTPYFDIGTQVQIRDPKGQVILQDSIESIVVSNDKEYTYNTTAGEDIKKIRL